ncbi:MAG: N-formylglutamate amidohydrolase [Pirellulales bacterium]
MKSTYRVGLFTQLAALGFACAAAANGLFAAEPHPLVVVQKGTLPVILSAPHGGTLAIPDAEPRRGEGLARKPGGFVVARDGGTEELAAAVSAALEKRTRAKPHSVVARSHRKYLDPNRKPAQAYESPAAKDVYDAYHNALADACRDVQNAHRAGLLIDLHGQGAAKDTVFRGTQNGVTVARLRERFGDEAHTGENSLLGLLKSRGWKVHPDPYTGKEQAGFTGGHIVQRYGSHEFGIDAIQLELGGDYRSAGSRERVADQLADAILDYSRRYLAWKPSADAVPASE